MLLLVVFLLLATNCFVSSFLTYPLHFRDSLPDRIKGVSDIRREPAKRHPGNSWFARAHMNNVLSGYRSADKNPAESALWDYE